MGLTTATAKAFDAGDRRRGRSTEMIDRVDLVSVDESGVRAHVGGSNGEIYSVFLDFEYLYDSELGVSCECPRFADGFACKHVWATMETFDARYKNPLGNTKRLSLIALDPDDYGDSEPAVLASTPNRVPPRSGIFDDWQSELWNLSRSTTCQSASPAKGLPTEYLSDSVCATQHWFVFSISEPINADTLQVVAMRSERKADGDWGRPVAVEMTPSEITGLKNADERHALATLDAQAEFVGYSRYGYYREGHRLYTVPPPLLQESLEAMHATGRLAWKLGESKQHFEDARPVDHLCVTEWTTIRLRVDPDLDQPSELVVSPELLVPQRGTRPIEAVVWASKIGCALLSIESPPESTRESERVDAAPRTCMVRLSSHDCRLIQSWQRTQRIRVPRASLNTLLVELAKHYGEVDLVLHESLGVPERLDEPSANCLLEQREPRATNFTVSLTAQYPSKEMGFDSEARWWFDPDAVVIDRRNRAAEQRWLSTFDPAELGFSLDRSQTELELAPERFLHVVESLREAGWNVTANGAPIRIASDFDIQVTSGVDWFDLEAEVAFGGVNVSLPKLLEALHQGEQAIELDDGSVGMLPKDWLSKFVGVQETGRSVDGAIRFHRSQGFLLDLLLQEQGDVKHDRDFSKFLRQVKSFDGIKPIDPPKTFHGELRDYQCAGLGWLRFLQKFGFGGCLADDMGLGKTIQVLALLDARRRRRVPKGETRHPSIVVVPKSLVFNWLDEAARFTPNLRVRNHTGTERKADWERFAECPDSIDVLLTTYGTMRIDAPLLAQLQFDYAILDEAQAIKNPKSLVARASRLLPAEHRLAMTGTPVENHLGDLWSLFDFLNPGMLANAQSSSGQLPDLDDPSQRQHVERLAKSLQPFILRRTKSEVLTELPAKVEQTLTCSMEKKQRKLYDELRKHYRIHLSNKVKELGLKKSKIHVLEALLRLRQAACDPRLIHPNCGVRGAKIDELLERLEELRREGRKALVFSQFTSLLGLLKQDLDRRGWDYEYLDGRTRKRADKVKRFQTDPGCQLFLVSLKAGGNGLNLTAAQYVFILDPWWNPAVEAQAIDRAHRMGQTSSVNAYRMICSETVEEKIVELQKTKRNLADAIVSQNKTLIGQLTAQDLQDLLG